MNNVTVGGYDPRRGEHSTSYETIAGGRPGPPGMHATQARMTNTLNTPIEALEHALPFRVARYSIRHNSGGRGQFPGDGIIRERESLNVSQFVEVQSDQKRRKVIATAAEDSAHLLKYLRLFHFLAVK